LLRTRASGSGEAFLTIVGCDFHPGWQQVAVFDSATGEIREQKLKNGNGEGERFYRSLPSPARVGFEACGNTQWFEDLLDGLGHEVWIGDAAEIRASYVRKQKTDRRDAAHILKLLIEGRFPRLWRPSRAERDLRQLLIHCHRLVGIGTRVKNGLQHLMLNRWVQLKHKLWSEAGQKVLRELPPGGLFPGAAFRNSAEGGECKNDETLRDGTEPNRETCCRCPRATTKTTFNRASIAERAKANTFWRTMNLNRMRSYRNGTAGTPLGAAWELICIT